MENVQDISSVISFTENNLFSFEWKEKQQEESEKNVLPTPLEKKTSKKKNAQDLLSELKEALANREESESVLLNNNLRLQRRLDLLREENQDENGTEEVKAKQKELCLLLDEVVGFEKKNTHTQKINK